MPIYEYQCQAGHQFEAIQRISESPLEVCENDGCGAKAERIISQSAFILKGGGWYNEGYASTRESGSGAKKADTTPSSTPSTASSGDGGSSGSASD